MTLQDQIKKIYLKLNKANNSYKDMKGRDGKIIDKLAILFSLFLLDNGQRFIIKS